MSAVNEKLLSGITAAVLNATDAGGSTRAIALAAGLVAQEMLDELLERFTRRGEDLLALERENQRLQEKMNRASEKSSGHARTTKRERFAAMAMQGALASAQWNSGQSDNVDLLAPMAVRFADALLRALEQKKDPT